MNNKIKSTIRKIDNVICDPNVIIPVCACTLWFAAGVFVGENRMAQVAVALKRNYY